MLRPITQESVTHSVVDQIVDLIKHTPLRPGDKLPSEKELLLTLNVSRPTVREALRVLGAMGLIESRRGQGSFVREVSADAVIRSAVLSMLLATTDVQEIQYARKLIESDIVATVVERAAPEDYEAVEETLKGAEQALAAGASIYEHTWEFHRALAQIAGNRVLAKLLAVLYQMIRELQIQYYEPHIDPRQEVESHRQLLRRLRSATPEEGRQLIRQHLEAVDQVMLTALTRQTDGGRG
jgi:GntR family transcriptional repressor for pyruvate dehydrogenase complex